MKDKNLDQFPTFEGHATPNLIVTHLESLILQDLLDGNIISVVVFGDKFGLKDDAKRAITDNFTVRVRDVTSVARLAIRGDDFDHLSGIVDGCMMITSIMTYSNTGRRGERGGVYEGEQRWIEGYETKNGRKGDGR